MVGEGLVRTPEGGVRFEGGLVEARRGEVEAEWEGWLKKISKRRCVESMGESDTSPLNGEFTLDGFSEGPRFECSLENRRQYNYKNK